MASLALTIRDQAGVRRPQNEKRGGSQGYHRVSGLVQRNIGGTNIGTLRRLIWGILNPANFKQWFAIFAVTLHRLKIHELNPNHACSTQQIRFGYFADFLGALL